MIPSCLSKLKKKFLNRKSKNKKIINKKIKFWNQEVKYSINSQFDSTNHKKIKA